jgi:hypothetical protein
LRSKENFGAFLSADENRLNKGLSWGRVSNPATNVARRGAPRANDKGPDGIGRITHRQNCVISLGRKQHYSAIMPVKLFKKSIPEFRANSFLLGP